MGQWRDLGYVVVLALAGCQSDTGGDDTAGEGPAGLSGTTEASATSGDETDSAGSGVTTRDATGGTSDAPTGDETDSAADTDDTGSGGETGEEDELPPCDAYSSPEGGGEGADGSLEQPWGSLESLAATQSIPEGTLCLMEGFHGNPLLQAFAPATPTMIRAQHRGTATVATLRLQGVVDVAFWGITVDGSTAIDPEVDQRQMFLVTGDAATSGITFDAMRVQSADTSEAWTQDGWVYDVRSGIDFRGSDITISDSEIRNTYHALLLRGDGSLVEGNTIDNFGGDAIRGLGNDSRYSWNLIRDAYIDEYEYQHDDAFQAYRLEGEDLRISNVTIDHNRIFVFADPITDFVLEHELVGTLMQGVIITDGYADGWVVENNLVVNSQTHGISLFGARNCRVQNNTVVPHPEFIPETGPWIRIADQTKTGQENFDNIIRNNLAHMLTPWDYDSTSIVEANYEAAWGESFFKDHVALDFRLAPTSPAINAGIDSDLPTLDLDSGPRQVGSAVDLGAYESSR